MARGSILYGDVPPLRSKKRSSFVRDFIRRGVFLEKPEALLFSGREGVYLHQGDIYHLFPKMGAEEKRSNKMPGAPLTTYDSAIATLRDREGYFLLPDGEIIKTPPLPGGRPAHLRFSGKTFQLIMSDGSVFLLLRNGDAWQRMSGITVRKIIPDSKGLLLAVDDDEGQAYHLHHEGSHAVYSSENFQAVVFDFAVSDKGEIVFLDEENIMQRYNFIDQKKRGPLFVLDESINGSFVDLVADRKTLYLLDDKATLHLLDLEGKEIGSHELDFQPHSLRFPDSDNLLLFDDARYEAVRVRP